MAVCPHLAKIGHSRVCEVKLIQSIKCKGLMFSSGLFTNHPICGGNSAFPVHVYTVTLAPGQELGCEFGTVTRSCVTGGHQQGMQLRHGGKCNRLSPWLLQQSMAHGANFPHLTRIAVSSMKKRPHKTHEARVQVAPIAIIAQAGVQYGPQQGRTGHVGVQRACRGIVASCRSWTRRLRCKL